MSTYHLTRTAVYMILEKDDSYLYLRRKNTGWNDGKLTVPAGHVEEGESAVEAVIREAEEEVGVKITESDVQFLHAQYVYGKYTNFYFHAQKWEGLERVNEPDLASEIVWIPKLTIPVDAVNCLRHALQASEKGLYFSDTPDDPGDGRFDGEVIHTSVRQ